MEDKRNFILGLGNQKCGTSWLYQYLCQSELFAEGYAKEYHIWDKLDIPIIQHLGADIRKKFAQNENFYFDYFDKLISNGKYFTADITPSYCGLKSERLKYIKKKFIKRGIETKVVILVREPVSRIKSAVRDKLNRNNFSGGITPGETDFLKALKQYYLQQHCVLRTRYQEIIFEAKQSFDHDDIYIGFYENMFEKDEVQRLSDFLRIDTKLEFAKVQVNKTLNAVHDETEMDALIRDFYADTYDYFYKKYPISQELWKYRF